MVRKGNLAVFESSNGEAMLTKIVVIFYKVLNQVNDLVLY